MTHTIVVHVDLLVLHCGHLHGVQVQPQVLVALQLMDFCNTCRQHMNNQ